MSAKIDPLKQNDPTKRKGSSLNTFNFSYDPSSWNVHRALVFFLAFSDILFISEWLPSNCLQLLSTLSDNSSVFYIARLGTAKNKFTRDGFAFPFLKSNRTNISVQEIKLESERILGIEINHETNYVW